eukprot:1145112-Pelagomonas_calceolata.AAC.7
MPLCSPKNTKAPTTADQGTAYNRDRPLCPMCPCDMKGVCALYKSQRHQRAQTRTQSKRTLLPSSTAVTCTVDIWLVVSVPVLSEQITAKHAKTAVPNREAQIAQELYTSHLTGSYRPYPSGSDSKRVAETQSRTD